MLGTLTTHVLDTSIGKPAEHVFITLYKLPEKRKLRECYTNNDGRIDQPLLEGESLVKGTYELHFHVGEYFQKKLESECTFLDVVPVRFVISKDENYHVPLLISPGGYSTYRGS
ncbi:hydroxyisourate hydrolase [Evansella sp. AB-rgal1]|uniref:hydroxyisourate hydrolase n=1 Tax=Evansella sp. AB-rgal1 TaxID=3242696 RepID=UPI00359D4D88